MSNGSYKIVNGKHIFYNFGNNMNYNSRVWMDCNDSHELRDDGSHYDFYTEIDGKLVHTTGDAAKQIEYDISLAEAGVMAAIDKTIADKIAEVNSILVTHFDNVEQCETALNFDLGADESAIYSLVFWDRQIRDYMQSFRKEVIAGTKEIPTPEEFIGHADFPQFNLISRETSTSNMYPSVDPFLVGEKWWNNGVLTVSEGV